MTITEQLLLILGMSAVTYISRALPLLLLSSRTIPQALMRWLEVVPPAVLAALLASELFFHKEGGVISLYINTSNSFLLAAIPTFISGLIFRNFFITITIGILSLAMIRFFFI